MLTARYSQSRTDRPNNQLDCREKLADEGWNELDGRWRVWEMLGPLPEWSVGWGSRKNLGENQNLKSHK